MEVIDIVSGVGIAAVGAIVSLVLVKRKHKTEIGATNAEIERIEKAALQEAANILEDARLKAQEIHLQKKSEFESETISQRKELQKLEKKVLQKEDNIDKKVDLLNSKEIEVLQRERDLSKKESEFEKKNLEIDELSRSAARKLEKISGMTQDEAKEELQSGLMKQVRAESMETIKKIERETKQTAEDRAKEIICIAIQRCSAEFISETAVSVVSLPSEDMKGRIIGREGRNIRAIEAATGVDVIIDDTPEAVVLSSFDALRRAKAKLLLEKLLQDGRIHPARIEELAKKIEIEFDGMLREVGEQASFDIGINGIHVELLKLLGKLKYFTMGQQSILQHSLEVAVISGIMAAEIGLNVKTVKRAGLLHCIGKSVGQEVEGAYYVIGADLAKKYGENGDVIDAIRRHTDNYAQGSDVPVIIAAAKKLSMQRPGARKEVLETYIKRLDDLESLLNSVDSVDKAFVIQAGKEIRVFVESDGVTDDSAVMVMRDVERAIKDNILYPGQINITLLKETRAISFAK